MPKPFVKELALSIGTFFLTAGLARADDTITRFDKIKQASCPEKVEAFPLARLSIQADAVPLGPEDDVKAALPSNVDFIGGWHLTAADSRFGGLSGMDILPNGDLLTVSDKGTFFVIGLTDNIPNGRGAMTPLLDSRGRQLTRKKDSDSEGLVYDNGLVFVSFERDHRVLAYDLFTCQAAARGIKIINFPQKLMGKKIPNNNGAEALDITAEDDLIAGFEFEREGEAPIAVIPLSGSAPLKDIEISSIKKWEIPAPFSLVGLSKTSSLLRSYDSETGNKNIIRIDGGATTFTLEPPLNVDNFEGIAETRTHDGRRLIYILSDDNFSGLQRSLLYAFEVKD